MLLGTSQCSKYNNPSEFFLLAFVSSVESVWKDLYNKENSPVSGNIESKNIFYQLILL